MEVIECDMCVSATDGALPSPNLLGLEPRGGLLHLPGLERHLGLCSFHVWEVDQKRAVTDSTRHISTDPYTHRGIPPDGPRPGTTARPPLPPPRRAPLRLNGGKQGVSARWLTYEIDLTRTKAQHTDLALHQLLPLLLYGLIKSLPPRLWWKRHIKRLNWGVDRHDFACMPFTYHQRLLVRDARALAGQC